MTVLLSLFVAIAIGEACRALDIPLPAPPRLEGALLVLAMTLGVIVGQFAFP